MQVTWTPLSLTDLANIRAYIYEENPLAVNNLLARLVFAGNELEAFPNRGRPTGLANVRELAITGVPYLLVYRVVAKEVQILRVWHDAQDRG